jgi:hypothetical protein
VVSKKGISSKQMQHMLVVNYSAWFMTMRLTDKRAERREADAPA